VSSSGTSRRRSIGLRNVSRRGGLSTAPRDLSGCDGPRPDVSSVRPAAGSMKSGGLRTCIDLAPWDSHGGH